MGYLSYPHCGEAIQYSHGNLDLLTLLFLVCWLKALYAQSEQGEILASSSMECLLYILVGVCPKILSQQNLWTWETESKIFSSVFLGVIVSGTFLFPSLDFWTLGENLSYIGYWHCMCFQTSILSIKLVRMVGNMFKAIGSHNCGFTAACL